MKKKTHKKIKLYSFDKLHEGYLKNPEYKKAYEESQPEFELLKAIVIARARQGLTQRQLAQRIGMTQSALARFERGRSNPTWASIKKMINGLGLKLTVG